MIKRTISLFVILLVISITFAQEFEIEEIDEELPEEEFSEEEFEEEFIEEEYVEEEVLIEERAGTTPDSPFYFVDEVIEDINLAIKKGEDKADYALKVAEEKVAEAKLMADKNKSTETEKALTKANNVSAIIEQEVSPELENETKEKMEFIKGILKDMEEQIPEDWSEIKSLIDAQKTQAEKNEVAANLATKIGDLCEKLAMQDWKLMEEEPRCNPDMAPEWLKDYVKEELKDREENAKKNTVESLTQCFTDPRECDCSDIPVRSYRKMCEKAVPLAIQCEFEFNMRACDELDAIDLPDITEGPKGLEETIEKKFTEVMEEKEEELFDKFAPPECKEKGLKTKEDCEELMHEIYGPPPEECMENGKFIGPEECEEIMTEKYGPTPPECLDEEGHFIGELECMKIMAPECVKAGITSFDDCKIEGKHGPMPEECINEDGTPMGREECEAIMEEKYGPIPEECLDENGDYVGDEECIAAIMPECAEAGGTTFEECEGMWGSDGDGQEGLPMGCIENGGYIGKDACDEVIWDQMGRPPEECFKDGEFIGGDYCKELTGEDYGGAPPDECVVGTEFIGHDECKDIMGWGEEGGEFGPSPSECIENGMYIGDKECMQRTDPGCANLGASNWDECHNIMKEKYGMSPDECFEKDGMGFVGEGKCAQIIKENYKSEDEEGTAPDYCSDEGEYVGDDECSRRNDERQDEYVEDLYDEINDLERDLEGEDFEEEDFEEEEVDEEPTLDEEVPEEDIEE